MILVLLIHRIEVRVERVHIQLCPRRLVAFLRGALHQPEPATPAGEDEPLLILSAPARLRRAGMEMRMQIDATLVPGQAARPDPKLIKLIARAHLFRDKLIQSRGVQLLDVAQREKLCGSYFTRLVRLSYLASDITRAILDGRPPRDLTAEKLLDHSRLPLTWPEQRRVLGFA
jgi:hypothetical protein